MRKNRLRKIIEAKKEKEKRIEEDQVKRLKLVVQIKKIVVEAQ